MSYTTNLSSSPSLPRTWHLVLFFRRSSINIKCRTSASPTHFLPSQLTSNSACQCLHVSLLVGVEEYWRWLPSIFIDANQLGDGRVVANTKTWFIYVLRPIMCHWCLAGTHQSMFLCNQCSFWCSFGINQQMDKLVYCLW